jgi:hypothetical protein
MTDQGSSSASGSNKLASMEQNQVPVISTIDDAVSLIRSLEPAADSNTSSTANLVPAQIYDVLLPVLKRQYHSQKGKGQRLFIQALQGGIDPLAMLDPARNTLGYAYIL